jgi:hypothetical protein
VQLYHYFVSQSSEFCRHNPLCCFSTSVYCCYCYFVIDSVRKLLNTLSQSLSQEITAFYGTCFHKSPPLVPILKPTDPVYTLPYYFPVSSILCNTFASMPRSSKLSRPFSFSDQNFLCILVSPMQTTGPTHLILLDLFTLTIFVERNTLWSSSLCSLLQPCATSSLLGPNILNSP